MTSQAATILGFNIRNGDKIVFSDWNLQNFLESIVKLSVFSYVFSEKSHF